MYWHGPIQLLIVEDELYVYDRGSYRGSRFQGFSLGGAYRRTVFGEDLSNLRVCQFVYMYAHGRLYACETDPCDACICVLTIEGATVQIYENPWAKLLHSAVVDGGALVLSPPLRGSFVRVLEKYSAFSSLWRDITSHRVHSTVRVAGEWVTLCVPCRDPCPC